MSLGDEIIVEREKYPKTVIFVTDYKHCTMLYCTIHSKLGKYLTIPPGYPHISEFLVVDMYTRVNKEGNHSPPLQVNFKYL